MAGANMVWIDGQAYAPNHRRVREHYAKIKAQNDAQPMGGLRHTERQPDTVPALDSGKKAHRSRKGGVASGITVHIIGFRSRLLDSDNFITGAKPIRDAIARSLALDDSDQIINWKYHQLIAEERGTLVLLCK